MFLCPFVSLFICLYNIYVSSQNHVFIKTKKVVGIWKMDIYFCPKSVFPEKNLAKKSMIFIFSRTCSQFRFFHRNLPLQPFFEGFVPGSLGGIFAKKSPRPCVHIIMV